MGKPVLGDRIFQCPRDVRLSDQVIESLRPVFSRENLVTHGLNVMRESDARKQKRILGRALRLLPGGCNRRRALQGLTLFH